MNQLKKFRRSASAEFLVGAGVGVLVFLLLYGASTLDVTYDSWIYRGYMEQDIVQRYAGWMFYRAAPWSWPLTVAENFAMPYGGSIAFTDSLPLAAMVCKLFAPLLPATFQYFGWVNLLNFALQGGFALLLLRHFKLGWLYSAGGSLLFVLMPVFVERAFRHDALGAQWLILAALLLYLRARRGGRFPAGGFFALCVLAPTIHTYFVPMVYAILAAALLEWAGRLWAVRGQDGGAAGAVKLLARPALVLACCFAGTLVVAYAIGLLTRGGGGAASGFGDYSMNLNALISQTSFDWYAPDEALGWSRLLPTLPRFHHQYDGFNYLGLGMLLAWVGMGFYGLVRAAIALRRRDRAIFRRAGAFLKSHVWLLAVCVCLAMFSLSNIVTWGEHILFSLPLPAGVLRLCAIFRASGRLFWPVNVLLFLTPLVFYGRVLKGKWTAVALTAMLVVQLFDLSGALGQKHAYFSGERLVQEDAFTSEGWVFLTQNYNNALCLYDLRDYNLAAGLIRYNPNMRTNMIFTNRGEFTLIGESYGPAIEALRAGQPVPEDTFYILEDRATFDYILEGLHPDARGYQVGGYYMIANPLPGCPLAEFVYTMP